MSQHTALSSQDHRELRVATSRRAELGDGEMVCVTFPDEFRDVQAHYPIVFQKDPSSGRFNALTLMGFEQGENLFLTDRGWDAAYIPLGMDIRPFLIGRGASAESGPSVHIDMASPRVGDANGVRLFGENGQPTDFLDVVTHKLGRVHAGFPKTDAFMQSLTEFELLEAFSMDIQLNDGSQHKLAGFHTIHEERLAALPAPDVALWHERGQLMPIFMVIASLAHFKDLIARRNARLGHV